MATPEKLEIYKQRYDTYRHLDRLRWQIFQIAVGAGTLTLAFARGTEQTRLVGIDDRWFYVVYLRDSYVANRTWNKVRTAKYYTELEMKLVTTLYR